MTNAVDSETPDCEQLFDVCHIINKKEGVSQDVLFLSKKPKFRAHRVFSSLLDFQIWLTEKSKRGYSIVSVTSYEHTASTEHGIFWNKDK